MPLCPDRTILYLEDSDLDAELVGERLHRDGFKGEVVRAKSREEFLAQIDGKRNFDLILSDYQIPSFGGEEALAIALERRPGVPFVFVSGALGEDLAVEMLKTGATDYILKHRLRRLAPAIERAISEAQARTERSQSEALLAETEGRLRLAFDAVRMVAWELIPSPRRVAFVGNVTDVFGLPVDDVLATREQRETLLHPDDVGPHFARVEQAIAEGGSYVARFRIVRPDNGAVQWLEERAHAIRDEDGNTVRLVGVVVDVTDKKHAEDEVNRLTNRLEEEVVKRTAELLAANEQLQGFTYSVAHDLRQQIRGISTNAAVVLEEAPDALEEVHRHNLRRLVHSAKQLSVVVDDLLNYARLGRQQPRVERVDLSALASLLGEQLAEEYGDKAVDFEVEPGMIVFGDPSMLAIALQNLIDNAFKYSSQKESPRIRVGREGRGFFVSDNGVGFDMAYAAKVFVPFERLHAREFSGTGIGLANVKRIVERHGGTIKVESAPGVGTSFYFHLGDEPSGE